MDIRLKRAYDNVKQDDGCRILIDRLWPRGVSREQLQLTNWLKKLAPSEELRKWFDHDPAKFDDFSRRYKKELETKKEEVEKLLSYCQNNDRVTLIYAAKDRKHNNAVVLKEFLEGNIDL